MGFISLLGYLIFNKAKIRSQITGSESSDISTASTNGDQNRTKFRVLLHHARAEEEGETLRALLRLPTPKGNTISAVLNTSSRSPRDFW